MPLVGRPLHLDSCIHCRHITQGVWRQPPPEDAYDPVRRCAHCEHEEFTEQTGKKLKRSLRKACDHCAHS